MAQFQILYWHDIPLQVRVKERRDRVSKELSGRFQIAVDNASMQAGLTGTEAYLAQLRWSPPQDRPGTPEEVASAVAEELENQFAAIDWRKTAAELLANRED